MTEAESLQARRYHLLEPLSRAADEIKRIDDRLSAVLAGNQDHGGSCMKGKCHSRDSRCNILKANERNDRRKSWQQARAKGYDRKAYDGTASEES